MNVYITNMFTDLYANITINMFDKRYMYFVSNI